jgi:hypothetical protein
VKTALQRTAASPPPGSDAARIMSLRRLSDVKTDTTKNNTRQPDNRARASE